MSLGPPDHTGARLEGRTMPAKRKKNNTHYTPPRRDSDTPADDQPELSNTVEQAAEHESSVSVTPEMLSAMFPKEHQQWVGISEESASEFSSHPEIVTTIPALKQGIQTTSTGGSSWKILVQHSANILRIALDLKIHQNPSSNDSMEMVMLLAQLRDLETGCLAVISETTTINLPEVTAATNPVTHNEPRTHTQSETRVYTAKELSEKVDKLTATIETFTPVHGTANSNREKQVRSYASVAALPKNRTPTKPDKRRTLQPINAAKTHLKEVDSRSLATAPLTDRRFVLQMETPLDANSFDSVAMRDKINECLPCSEVIGASRSRQGNLIVTCRTSAAPVLKHQHQWLPRLPPIQRVHDEERWVRRVVHIRETNPASSSVEISPGRIEREVCEYNSIKLAATPRLITDSTVLLFFEHEADAPKDLYVFGTRVRAMRYRPKLRPRRIQVDKDANREMEIG